MSVCVLARQKTTKIQNKSMVEKSKSYTEKPPSEQGESNQGGRVVIKLMEKYMVSRIIW